MFLSTWDHRFLVTGTFHRWIIHRTVRQSFQRLTQLHLQLLRLTRRRSRAWRAMVTGFLQEQRHSIPVRIIQLSPSELSHLRYQPQSQSQPQLQLRPLHMDHSLVLRLYRIQSQSRPHNNIPSWPTSDRSGNPTLCILNNNSRNSVASRIQDSYLEATAAVAAAVLGPYPHITRPLE